jgi:hypothetical protein
MRCSGVQVFRCSGVQAGQGREGKGFPGTWKEKRRMFLMVFMKGLSLRTCKYSLPGELTLVLAWGEVTFLRIACAHETLEHPIPNTYYPTPEHLNT